MNEAADAAGNLSAILLFWVWWAVLSLLDIASRAPGFSPDRESGATLPAADIDDERFAGIARLDPSFRLAAFLEGAERAYEAIVSAYAAGDMETLRPLVSASVLAAFEEACAGRARRGESLAFTLIGIRQVDILEVGLPPGAMEVTLRILADAVFILSTADGAVAEGDGKGVWAMTETWTFSRPVPVMGSAWILVATGA